MKNKKPIIGIVTKPLTNEQCPDSLWINDYIKDEFRNIVCNLDGIPIGILPCVKNLVYNDNDSSEQNNLIEKDEESIIESIKICDGIILQGGLTSDFYEVFIADYCIKHNIPIIGICAGFNNIARAIGIKLQNDTFIAKNHNIYQKAPCHDIIIRSGGIFDKLHLDRSIKVNSIHTISLDSQNAFINEDIIQVEAVAHNLRYFGCFDETIEAFSVKDTKFALAIKWHPELVDNYITNAIFNEFIKKCKKIRMVKYQ